MGFLTSLLGRLGIGTGEPLDWDALEATLYQADLGSGTVASIMTLLREKKHALDPLTITEATRQEIGNFLPEKTPSLTLSNKGPIVIFLVGVNGTGKTTSAAKLAYYLKNQGYSVLLAAADTFRAAAIEQLSTWGERLGIEVVKSHYGADAAALCHDALAKALRLRSDFLICDTAGRLHTKSNLMEELAKIKRTVTKLDPSAPHHTLLVVDTTTGTNAVSQAKEFHSAVTLTGLIITKIDGSGKGGVAVAIAREIGITPYFLGTGEGITDLAPFDRNQFLERLL
ncbi:MAG: signal recognition particle-docking protein FtsY [Verrucomicrobia bacterium]|jgi:fused signal recognition particle receptor|nr:MAG: signal recognition particle-docking protein FtsY [Verrucomicrobiota bacterium]MDH4470383.1 signal recognition particle-docking protein FtsY [Verrucomicrobiae bacterium]